MVGRFQPLIIGTAGELIQFAAGGGVESAGVSAGSKANAVDLEAHAQDEVAAHNIGSKAALSDLTFHAETTANVHGIIDTSVLVTANDLAQKLLSNQIADPGPSGVIGPTTSGHVQIVTAAAETRALLDPTFVGQLLLINMKTDGGDCVIVAATPIEAYGTGAIVLDTAGDAVLLVGSINGVALRWRVVENQGVPSIPQRGPTEYVRTDPGDGEGITTSTSGIIVLVSGPDPETRTMIGPGFIGQQLIICLGTDGGGNVELTIATTFNQVGNTTITFEDAGDTVLLVGKQKGAARRWSLVMNDGCTLG